ncbi:alpha/beta hydrolase [Amycolatopsis mongoliensis]
MIGLVADALNSRCTQLVAANDDVEAMAKLDGWTGDASIAATSRGNSLISTLEQTVAEVSAVRRAADEVQIAAERLTAFTFETDALARAHGLAVSDDGAVSPLPAMGPPPPPDVAAIRARVQVEVADRVGQILRRAGDVDADFAAVMTRALRGEITEQGVGTLAQAAQVGAAQSGLSIIGPPEGGTPDQAKAWWDSLSDTAKGAILRDNPDLVRNLDGIPVADRDAANRTVLAHEIARLRGDTSEQGRLELQGLLDIDKRLNHAEPGQPQAFLVGLDTSGQGKAIVASGNPDTAANVATYVPGTGSELGKIGGDIDRSDKMWHAADRSGSPSTAVVTWVGYDAPDDIAAAGSESYADNGKDALGGFQDGLRATHQGDALSHNTVLGHSYGTTVVGHAARDGGLNADELVFVASPGVGVDTADQLHLDGVNPGDIGHHVHSTVADHDMIKVTNLEVGDDSGASHDIALGPDPTAPQFGGQTFTSAPGTAGPWYTGGLSSDAHSQYWEDRSPSLRNFGLIIAGKPTS